MDKNTEIVETITGSTSDLLQEFTKHFSSEASATDVNLNNSFQKRIKNHLNSCYQFSEDQVAGIKNPVNITFDSSNIHHGFAVEPELILLQS